MTRNLSTVGNSSLATIFSRELTGLINANGNSEATSKTSPTGEIVGTTDAQVLTNKTLTSPTINTPTIANPTITGASITGTITSSIISNATFTDGYTEESFSANTGTALTIDLANGTLQILTLTGICTFTFPTATVGKSFTMLLKQDAGGSKTVTWPSSVKWPASVAPTLTATGLKGDMFIFVADGTFWWGYVPGQNYL